MKFGIVLALFVVIGFAAAQQDIQTLRNSFEQGEANYKFEYQLSDQQSRQEEGELRNIGAENEGIAVRGSYSFIGDDGITYTVNYIADENGFQPEGAHIPRA